MENYLKLFKNEEEYENTEKENLPVYSHVIDDVEMHRLPVINGHEYVDLGLPSGTKWATMNVGATDVTDYGNYYKYGFGADTYQVTSGESDYRGTENPLAASADTAIQSWGGGWHMPTKEQYQELVGNTTYQWVTIDGVNGAKFTAQNGNYIFFPATGFYYHDEVRLHSRGSLSYIWASTPRDNSTSWCLYVVSGAKKVDWIYRTGGYPVRPVVG